jgi:hypothetical protein
MAAVSGGDARRIASIGQRLGAELVVAAGLASESEPSVGKFHTGRATLDLRIVRAEDGRILGSDSVAVGSGGRPGKLEPSGPTARSAAAREAGALAGAAVLSHVGAPRPAEMVTVLIYGVASAAEANALAERIAALAGGAAVEQRSLVAGERLELAVSHAGAAADLGKLLEGQAVGSRRLRIQSIEGRRLSLEVE